MNLGLGLPITGVAASGVWSPSKIGGLAGWWDASNAASITDAGGGAVSAWADLSGNGRNLTQGTAGSRPTTGANTQNGRNVLTFPVAGNRSLTAAAAAPWKFMHDGTPWWGAMVSKFVTGSASGGWYGTVNTAATDVGVIVGRQSSNRAWVDIGNGSALVCNHVSVVSDYALDAAYSVINEVDADAATAARSTIYLNGTVVATSNASTGAVSAADPATALSVGTAGTYFVAGDLAELIIGVGTLTATQRAAIQAYLKAKWGTP